MAWLLFTLGRWCFRHRWPVIAIWVVVLAGTGVGSATLAGTTKDSFDMPGLESTQAFALIKERSPDASSDGATARIVMQAPAGQRLTDQGPRARVEAALKTVTTPHVSYAASPFDTGAIAGDERTGYATVGYDRQAMDLDAADKSAMDDAVRQLKDAGLVAAVGGDAFPDQGEAPASEAVGVLIALVVLAITFGSLLAAGMPLLTALIGVGIGITGITTLTGFIELSSTTPALATMLGLAVGIDYALFIMSRYQHEVRAGRSRADAAGVAIGTAGSAVVFAGLTVIIALVGLAVCGITFLTEMGLAAAATVAVAVLIALTLLPAIVSLGGLRVARARKGLIRPAHQPGDTEHKTFGRRWGEFVVRHRVVALIAGLAAAVVIAVPVLSLELALPDDSTAPADSGRRQAYDLISTNFGAGANGPLTIVVDTRGAADPVAAVDRAVTTVRSVKTDIAAVEPPVDTTDPASVDRLRKQLAAVDFTIISVMPSSGPADVATKDLVATLRAAFATLPAQTGARALVTGTTAVGVDIADSLIDVFPTYLVVVVGLAFVLLILVFRSLLVPLKAALGFLLSIGIALGATVAVFQWGWLSGLLGIEATAPVVFILPVLLTGILFGLAMDYEVFLVTRIREEHVHGARAHPAITNGFAHSARVVTAAAIIMMGVFAGFAASNAIILQTIGFALTVGVLADAFLVRMTIVPAIMAIIGERMWWLPKWLDRALPNLDIEGDSLKTQVPGQRTDATPIPKHDNVRS
ncbi:MMPL family transporter [Actinokineospora enzanensis]|uniref:MMPL family transporter n=1 Tax=Actinokineospora enzanensis TaxID=155975 RepID=UPI0003A9882E|nr:MMPL family transporter [Actinokineospora enzanensis]